MQFINLAGYKFVALDDLAELRSALASRCRTLGMKGTILLSPEGINAFVAGTAEAAAQFLAFFRADPRFADLKFKESRSDYQPFRRMLVKINAELKPFDAGARGARSGRVVGAEFDS